MGTPMLIHRPNGFTFNRAIENGLDAVLEKAGVGGIAFAPLCDGEPARIDAALNEDGWGARFPGAD